MQWQDIKISPDNTHFLFEGKLIFGKCFTEVLKFHLPGLAPVRDETGSYHIDTFGKQLYPERFTRTFGYYCNRASVVQDDKWFHLTEKGKAAYSNTFSWSGNYQENLCPVRDKDDNYFHIDLNGVRVFSANFIYCGDFKDGYACVKTSNGMYRHINTKGEFLNDKEFLDLGLFHKNFATAKDKNGWFHIDKRGREIYTNRFSCIEPFYNGFALVTQFDNQKSIINEAGQKILTV